MSTDILRILILLNFKNSKGKIGDIYIDIDLDFEEVDINCQKYLCVNKVQNGTSNSAFLLTKCKNIQEKYQYELCVHDRKMLYTILTNQYNGLRNLYGNKAKYALYLSYPQAWSNYTISITGPGSIPILSDSYYINIPERQKGEYKLGEEKKWLLPKRAIMEIKKILEEIDEKNV